MRHPKSYSKKTLKVCRSCPDREVCDHTECMNPRNSSGQKPAKPRKARTLSVSHKMLTKHNNDIATLGKSVSDILASWRNL